MVATGILLLNGVQFRFGRRNVPNRLNMGIVSLSLSIAQVTDSISSRVECHRSFIVLGSLLLAHTSLPGIVSGCHQDFTLVAAETCPPERLACFLGLFALCADG